jgi:hypothetical protein
LWIAEKCLSGKRDRTFAAYSPYCGNAVHGIAHSQASEAPVGNLAQNPARSLRETTFCEPGGLLTN